MAGRRCPATRCPAILTRGERYCPTHAQAYEARRGTRQARGYGTPHTRTRATWQARIDAGEHVTCATCPTPITPNTPWDLGHTPDRRGYVGPQCLPCNRGEGGRRGRATQD